MGKVDGFKKKQALDNIPNHEKFLHYRWKMLGILDWKEEEKEFKQYLEEFELYEMLRWPEEHYKRWERYERQCKEYEGGDRKMQQYEYDATKMLVRLGAEKMYWFTVANHITEIGGLENAKYILGMKAEIPEEYKDFLKLKDKI